jgi:hypothetical protein
LCIHLFIHSFVHSFIHSAPSEAFRTIADADSSTVLRAAALPMASALAAGKKGNSGNVGDSCEGETAGRCGWNDCSLAALDALVNVASSDAGAKALMADEGGMRFLCEVLEAWTELSPTPTSTTSTTKREITVALILERWAGQATSPEYFSSVSF